MVAGNTLLRLIGLAPDTYFFVLLALLCLAFIGGRLLVISKHLKALEKLLNYRPSTPSAHHAPLHSASSTAVSTDAPKPRRATTARTYPQRRRGAKSTFRKLQSAQQ